MSASPSAVSPGSARTPALTTMRRLKRTPRSTSSAVGRTESAFYPRRASCYLGRRAVRRTRRVRRALPRILPETAHARRSSPTCSRPSAGRKRTARRPKAARTSHAWRVVDIAEGWCQARGACREEGPSVRPGARRSVRVRWVRPSITLRRRVEPEQLRELHAKVVEPST